ncbi:MAG: hypothetical protein NC223_11220 [Butyrivibrio sp.]|nr:hypothetical protein [Butyrivibrio sp.]
MENERIMKNISISSDVIENYSKVLERHIYELKKMIDESQDVVSYILMMDMPELTDLFSKGKADLTSCINCFESIRKLLDKESGLFMTMAYAPPRTEEDNISELFT